MCLLQAFACVTTLSESGTDRLPKMPLRVFGVRLWRVVCLQFVCLPALGQSVPWFAILHVVTACWLVQDAVYGMSIMLAAAGCQRICACVMLSGFGDLCSSWARPFGWCDKRSAAVITLIFFESTSVIQQRSVTSQKEVQNYVQTICII
jgi:hypothetical protein